MAQYLKPDSELGYIEDGAEIENLKINNLRHTILGCMLGDFDETGAYVVAPEIVKELINMDKYVVETLDNIEICKSVLKLDKQITFMVTFEGNKATLSLIEKLSYEANFKINSGTYSNINEYVLDTVETSGEINRNVIYDRWHIGNFGGNVVDIFNCDEEVLEKYFGIVNRFKYLLHANKVLLEKEEQIEEIEAGYTNEIFEILKHYPKLQESVMKQIKETLSEKKGALSVNKPNFAKTFNEVLENAIVSNIGVLDEKEKADFETEKRNATVNLNVKRAEVFETEQVDVENIAEVDLTPRVVTLKINNLYSSKSIIELGEEFVAVHKNVVERKQNQQSNNVKTEKDKLLEILVVAGLGNVIGKIDDEIEITAGNLVAEVAEKVNAAKKAGAKAPTKKPEAKKAPAKKPAAKKAAAKKPGAKKGPAKKSDSKESNKKDDSKAKKEPQQRLFTIMTGYVKNEKPVVAEKPSVKQMLEMETEILKEKQQIKQAKIVAGQIATNSVVGNQSTKTKMGAKDLVAGTNIDETSILTDGL